MIIKNLTAKPQSLGVVDLRDDRAYSICIEGYSSTELLGVYLSTPLSDAFEIVTAETTIKEDEAVAQVIIEESVEDESIEEQEDNEEVLGEEETPQEEVKPEPEVAENKFICDLCGQEFASARGLNSHKNRVHLGEEK